MNRRRLLIGAVALGGGGLALAWLRPDPARARLAADASVLEPNAYLQITPSGEIILQIDKAELGQGVMTGFVTLVAEELEVPPERIEARLAPVHPLFQDPTQVTAESKSIRMRWRLLRETGAAARQMLLEAAAKRLGVSRGELRTDGAGNVVDAAGTPRFTYAQLAADAALVPVPRSVELRPRHEFRYIGTRVARVDVPEKITGSARFGIDVGLPGLATAVLVRSHEFGARLAGFDAAAALALPGVLEVAEISSGVAVLGETFWHAKRGADAVQASWSAGPVVGLSTAAVHDEQRRLLAAGTGRRVREDGDPDAALAAAGQLLEAEYVFPYLAHATMEPMNCTVALSEASAEVWAPSQGPDMVREAVCALTGLGRDQVTVHSTFCGGGFGRRALMDYVVEAVEIARAVRRPVKLIWTREDDIRHAYFRQATVHRTQARLGGDGLPRAWSHRLVAASLSRHVMPVALPVVLPEWVPRGVSRRLGAAAGDLFDWALGPFQAREGSATLPYAIDHVAVEVTNYDPGVPIGIWRSVGHSYNAFVVESFIDELAHAAGRDPAEYRRSLLGNHPRHLAVLDALLQNSGWGSPPAGRHQGMALHEGFGTVVGQVAEISLDHDRRIRVHRVTCAIDCGLAVNPDSRWKAASFSV
ncbi:MAG: molybdopterin-dependent oxidoreductase [Gammaproteobacteria bacterium]|nr:molybdopterin-dependent oxidoreductase [Gammaproteobacteria bacterium]